MSYFSKLVRATVCLDDLEVGSGLGDSLRYAQKPWYGLKVSSNGNLFLAINDDVELLARKLN